MIFLILGSKLVYDETTGEYLGRYGSKSIKKNQEKLEPYIEVKDG